MGFIFGVSIRNRRGYLVGDKRPGRNILAPVKPLGNAREFRFLASVDGLLLILLVVWSIYAYACLMKGVRRKLQGL